MSYESPIKLIETMTENIVDETNKAVDEYIYKSVLNVGVEVDRDELIRALRYDRDQYEKGYRDGMEAAKETMVEVVRCKDCKLADWYLAENGNYYCHCIESDRYGYEETDYCSCGIRRDSK